MKKKSEPRPQKYRQRAQQVPTTLLLVWKTRWTRRTRPKADPHEGRLWSIRPHARPRPNIATRYYYLLVPGCFHDTATGVEISASRSARATHTGARTSGGNQTRRDCGSGRWGAQRGGVRGGAGTQCCTNTHSSISHPLGSDRDEKRPVCQAERPRMWGRLDRRCPGGGQAWYVPSVAKARGAITRPTDRNNKQETNRRCPGGGQAWYASPAAKARGAITRRSDRNDKARNQTNQE